MHNVSFHVLDALLQYSLYAVVTDCVAMAMLHGKLHLCCDLQEVSFVDIVWTSTGGLFGHGMDLDSDFLRFEQLLCL